MPEIVFVFASYTAMTGCIAFPFALVLGLVKGVL
jgi:hypothetical protein